MQPLLSSKAMPRGKPLPPIPTSAPQGAEERGEERMFQRKVNKQWEGIAWSKDALLMLTV